MDASFSLFVFIWTVFLCTFSMQASSSNILSLIGYKEDDPEAAIPFHRSSTNISVHVEGDKYVFKCTQALGSSIDNHNMSMTQKKGPSLPLNGIIMLADTFNLIMKMENFDNNSTLSCMVFSPDENERCRLDIILSVDVNPDAKSTEHLTETKTVYYKEGDPLQQICNKDDDIFVILPEKDYIEKLLIHPKALNKSHNSTQLFCINYLQSINDKEGSVTRFIYYREVLIYNESDTLLFVIILTVVIVTIMIALILFLLIRRYRNSQENKKALQNEVLYTEIQLQPATASMPTTRHEQQYAQIVGVLAQKH